MATPLVNPSDFSYKCPLTFGTTWPVVFKEMEQLMRKSSFQELCCESYSVPASVSTSSTINKV